MGTEELSGRLMSDRIRARTERAIKQRDILNNYLSTAFKLLPAALRAVTDEDLVPQHETLLELKADATALIEAVDQAIAQNQSAQGKVDASVGHAIEAEDVVKHDKGIFELRDIATIILNDRFFFQGDISTVLAVLQIVDPPIFQNAFAKLPQERQVELIHPSPPGS